MNVGHLSYDKPSMLKPNMTNQICRRISTPIHPMDNFDIMKKFIDLTYLINGFNKLRGLLITYKYARTKYIQCEGFFFWFFFLN